jgi:hypothetical protein
LLVNGRRVVIVRVYYLRVFLTFTAPFFVGYLVVLVFVLVVVGGLCCRRLLFQFVFGISFVIKKIAFYFD